MRTFTILSPFSSLHRDRTATENDDVSGYIVTYDAGFAKIGYPILRLYNSNDMGKTIQNIKEHIEDSCELYNTRVKNFIVNFITYIIHSKEYTLNKDWLNKCQTVLHYIESNKNSYILSYFIISFLDLYKL